MRILKLFTEEPVALEILSDESDPDARRREADRLALASLSDPDIPHAYRAYLAGTDLTADRTGATALDEPRAFALPLAELFAEATWSALLTDGTGETVELDDLPELLMRPEAVAVLVAAPGPLTTAAMTPLADPDRRAAFAALAQTLEMAALVAFPEPAHDGFDWSLYAPEPLRDRLAAAFAHFPTRGLRRFAAPFQRVRSEQKFYFERWTLDDPPHGVVEL